MKFKNLHITGFWLKNLCFGGLFAVVFTSTSTQIYSQQKPGAIPAKPAIVPKQQPKSEKSKVAVQPPTTARPTSKPPAKAESPSAANKTASQQTTAPKKAKQQEQKTTVWVDRDTSLQFIKRIKGRISPKSVVHSGNGLFFAQNMMYNHTITVYNRNYELVKTIADAVQLADYGYENTEGTYRGAPVEVAFSHNGQYAWVSNYDMSGKGFEEELSDDCPMRKDYQNSFVYKINTETYKIEQVVGVGSVPKYVAVTPDNRYVLVTNWCSGDLSIIDIKLGEEIQRITLGSHPRGIVVDPDTQLAYIAIMGGSKIAVVNLNNFSLDWIPNVGITPRHICLSPDRKYLYVTLNNKQSVAKIDIKTRKVVAETYSGRAPRSMTISDDGQYLYVVNYNSNSISKIQTNDLSVVQKIKTDMHPIGITFDPQQNQIWVACYSGSIMVFKDRDLWYKGKPAPPQPTANDITATATTIAATSPDALQPPEVTLPIVQKKENTKLSTAATEQASKKLNKNVKTDGTKKSFFSNATATTQHKKITKPQVVRHKQTRYCVIGGSFDEQTKHKITAVTALLQSLGFEPELLTDGVLQKYRLCIGCFNSEKDAEHLLNQARATTISDAWILKQ